MRRILFGLGLAALVGCTGNGVPDGLVFETASAAAGLTGSYTRDGVTVHFAAIRGEANDLTADPGAPPFAMDARWTDAAGRSFLLSGGEDQVPVADDEVDGARRVTELQLALDGARQLAVHPAAALAAPERDALVGLAAVVERSALVRAPAGEINYACTVAYSHQLEVTYAPITWTAGIGEHSAVGLWSYRRGTSCTDTLYGYRDSCNHGRCASSSSMSTKCSWASSWRSNAWPPGYQETSTSPGTVSGACRTPYYAFPGISKVHVCNDDSVIQVYGIKNNAAYPSGTSGGTCADSSLRMKAPGC